MKVLLIRTALPYMAAVTVDMPPWPVSRNPPRAERACWLRIPGSWRGLILPVRSSLQWTRAWKWEIAALRYNGKDADRISDVTHELDAVVGDTEKATETILENCESIEKLVETLELQASSPEERATIEDVGAQVIGIYEACNFQDITGQRISKVVAALMFIEERVTRMMEIWGGTDIFAAIPLPEVQAKSEEDLLLNGPAREDAESATQADIDALFD